MWNRWFVSFVAGALIACVPTRAQEEPPSRSFDEELSVEVLNVEVYVTDRKGRAVTGLTREDFRLFEDGDPVEITYFSEIGEQAPSPAVEPSAVSPEPDAGVATARGVTNLVIYLDDSSVSPAGRRRVLADLREALAAGSDGADRLMLVIHDDGLKIAHPLTADRQALLATVDGLSDRVTGGFWQARERQGVLRAINEIYKRYVECVDPCDCGWLEMEATARVYAGEVAARVAAAAEGLSGLTSALSGVEGRKLVLYVADGLEQRPGLDVFQYVAELCPRYERELSRNYLDRDQTPLLHRLTADANANGVIFYTFEATGLQTDGDVSEMSLKLTPSPLVRQVATANRQSPLFALAADTGGRAALDTNSLDTALEAMASDLDSYYSLGFTSRHRGDGRLHRLKVEVPGRRGLQVRHRSYYRDKELETRLAERVWSTLLLGTGSNPFGAELVIGEPRPHGSACCTVPVEIRLPLDQATLGGSAGRRFYVVLTGRAATGEALPVKGREISVAAADGEEGTAWRTLIVEIELAPGPHELAVGLMDYQDGGEATLRADIVVRPPGQGAPGSR